jgi:TPR repeat protein
MLIDNKYAMKTKHSLLSSKGDGLRIRKSETDLFCQKRNCDFHETVILAKTRLSVFYVCYTISYFYQFYKTMSRRKETKFANIFLLNVIIVGIMSSTVVYAQDSCYDKGVRYYAEHNYVEAFQWFLKNAEQGNAVAQYRLGDMYRTGRGITQNYTEALKWHRLSAKKHNSDAQNSIGFAYQRGLGVKQDYYEAVRWFRKSAEQQNADAQNNLGFMYQHGYDGDREAVQWFRLSAEQGNAVAQFNLGYMYEQGRGITQDYCEAVQWYCRSAEQQNAYAQRRLGYMYENGFGVPQDKHTALEWYRKSADCDDDEAALNVLKPINKQVKQ